MKFSGKTAASESNDRVHIIGGIELNEDTVEVTVDEKPVKLTPIEFRILALLIKNPGRVFSADEIYERIWNEKLSQQIQLWYILNTFETKLRLIRKIQNI